MTKLSRKEFYSFEELNTDHVRIFLAGLGLDEEGYVGFCCIRRVAR